MTAGKIPPYEELLLSVELLAIHQVAKWARVSTKTIYRWIEDGRIPAMKFGERSYRVPAGAIIELLKQAGHKPQEIAITFIRPKSKIDQAKVPLHRPLHTLVHVCCPADLRESAARGLRAGEDTDAKSNRT